MYRRAITHLSIALTGDQPPSEFQIFAAGPNETTKGTFLFDDEAAALVMTEFQAHGIDLMLDYDHASLGTGIDPALSGKAAGWFQLEVRAGALWAVNVRWTPPAAEALARKEWRFMSPAFSTDEAGRVTSLLNVAITNLPATRRLQPLMAANQTVTLGAHMLDAETVKKALAALAAGDSEATMAILTEMIASAASGGAEPAEALAEEPAAAAEAPEEDKPEEVMAATSKILALSGKTSLVATLSDIETWRESHLKLETETLKLAAERKVLESAERRQLCVDLVVKAHKAPATVWASADKGAPPKAYLVAMPLADLRAMVEDEIKACGGRPAKVTPPSGGGDCPAGGSDFVQPDGRVVSLSARELAMCAEKKIDPKDYAANKPKKKD